jgi:hypothetical protein
MNLDKYGNILGVLLFEDGLAAKWSMKDSQAFLCVMATGEVRDGALYIWRERVFCDCSDMGFACF